MQNVENVLFINPYHGGSHKQLIDTLTKYVDKPTTVYLKPKKWHWKARCSGFILSDLIPPIKNEKVLFCTSVLNLAELLGLRPDLNVLKKVVYFHENQLVYPVQVMKERDVQYQINEITTCLCADIVIFNSTFNQHSFLTNINKIIKIIPDFKPKNITEKIKSKCIVLYYPISYPIINREKDNRPSKLHIIWPHRWEYDKNPEKFCNTLFKLKEFGKEFVVSFLGEQYSEIPEIFLKAKDTLKENILNYGYIQNRCDFLNYLGMGHVVVSTADHEFFGVAMLESTYLGCYPLVPNDLVYPEIYPKECLYKNEDELFEKLSGFCDNPTNALDARKHLNIDLERFSEETVIPKFLNVLQNT
nr:glycosyltransferase-like domain-containing protein 1 isoform X1 [Onthophagus taurus]